MSPLMKAAFLVWTKMTAVQAVKSFWTTMWPAVEAELTRAIRSLTLTPKNLTLNSLSYSRQFTILINRRLH